MFLKPTPKDLDITYIKCILEKCKKRPIDEYLLLFKRTKTAVLKWEANFSLSTVRNDDLIGFLIVAPI